MKLHAVISAYDTAIHGLIRDCETTNALETLDRIEERFAAVQAMFTGIMTEATDAEVVKMRRHKNLMFELFENKRIKAFTRVTQF